MYHNLQKAHRYWGVISKVLEKMVATVRSRGMLYKSVVQTFLFYESESWLVTGAMLKELEVPSHSGLEDCRNDGSAF